ncbi:MAG: SMP-30/gluconolactonase/LRE family protein [Deltaproteobacteria bacterium]
MKLKSTFLLILLSVYLLNGQIFDNLQPVKIASGFQFTEGPTWHPQGFLVFSDINANKIFKWSETTGISEFVNPSGKSNGIICTKNDDFYVCRHASRDVAKMTAEGVITTYISQYKGKKLNSPNDVELSYLGSIYFTDPDYGISPAEKILPYEGLFCIPYNQNQAILIDSTLIKPNGLTFNEDWRTLYVCESSSNNIYSYNLKNEYQIQDLSKDKKLFIHVEGAGQVDGICNDMFGNLYVAFSAGGIKIFSKTGIQIETISFPENERVRNLCFGGEYNNILFVTAGTSLYKVDIRFYGDFILPGILGVPTDKSVIFNALSNKNMECYISFGTNKNDLYQKTGTKVFKAETPIQIVVDGLNSNTKYFYKLFYKIEGESDFKQSVIRSFHTQRSKGENFSFAVEADPHLDQVSNYSTFRNMLKNASDLSPDFLIDLGDNFMTEKFPLNNEYYIKQRHLFYRNFWDDICGSIPLFIVQGNHDSELRWLSTNSPDDPFNTATRIRKVYYPSPEPDGFYTGSDYSEMYVGKRQNYYSWTWGDALFVVLDVYGYTEERSSDPWHFTLGKTQYDWFRKTLEESDAKFKFVFSHQLIGGDNLGRGGIERADFCEHGGYNTDGTYGFDDKRPGWGKPIHTLMVENGVQIFFHGHDHIYAEQKKDGIVYQECPQAANPNYTDTNNATEYGYLHGLILPNSGHLNVSILGDSAKVEYISAYHVDNPGKDQINGKVKRTYFVNAKKTNAVSSQDIEKQIDCYKAGNSLIVENFDKTAGNISVYSLTGKLVQEIFTGEIPVGKSYYEIPEMRIPEICVVVIKTSKYNIVKKIIR